MTVIHSQNMFDRFNEDVRLSRVKGKVAIANAKLAYQKFREIINSDRFLMQSL